MDIQELLQAINELLGTGLKVSDTEKELGFGDGEARTTAKAFVYN